MVMEAANTALVRRYVEEVHNQRNLHLISEVFAPALHATIRSLVAMMCVVFPDYHITITDHVADGDVVAIVLTIRGTHQGVWLSPIGTIAPTGIAVEYTGTTTVRLRDGKIVAIIASHHDHLHLLQQLRAVPMITQRASV